MADDLISIASDTLRVHIAAYGAALVSATRLDSGREFVLAPVDESWKPHHVGSVLGRFARIVGDGYLVIDGVHHQLSRNAGAHHLHGGNVGFSQRRWRIREHSRAHVLLSLRSAHAEEGYPGDVVVHAGFRAVGNRLVTWIRGRTDRPTLFGPCLHPYFALSGSTVDELTLRADVLDQLVQDAEFLPTGDRVDASWLRAGTRLQGRSLDCYFMPARMPWSAALQAPDGARVVLGSDAPGLAIYTGEQLPLARRGICLQASAPPLPRSPSGPDSILRPGQVHGTRTTYDFLEPTDAMAS